MFAHVSHDLQGVFDAIARNQAFVPFRDSTLTYLLEPALSGNGKTLMMLNLSPTEKSVPESLSSLRFGAKVGISPVVEAPATPRIPVLCCV